MSAIVLLDTVCGGLHNECAPVRFGPFPFAGHYPSVA